MISLTLFLFTAATAMANPVDHHDSQTLINQHVDCVNRATTERNGYQQLAPAAEAALAGVNAQIAETAGSEAAATRKKQNLVTSIRFAAMDTHDFSANELDAPIFPGGPNFMALDTTEINEAKKDRTARDPLSFKLSGDTEDWNNQSAELDNLLRSYSARMQNLQTQQNQATQHLNDLHSGIDNDQNKIDHGC